MILTILIIGIAIIATATCTQALFLSAKPKKVRRIDVINRALENHTEFAGICGALKCSFIDLGGSELINVEKYFPLCTRNNAIKHGFIKSYDSSIYWWWPEVWDIEERLGFLYWLKDQYKDDDTNLLTFKEEERKGRVWHKSQQ